jgi:acid phosphatase (class A)
MVYSLLLAEMFPEHGDAILAIGRQIGWHRVQLAMHYPTDIYAGRVLGQALVRHLKANHEFRRDFKRAKDEVAIFLNTPDHSGPN